MTSRYSKEKLSLIVRKNIRKYRLMRKYTLQELADLTGLTHGYVRDLECFSIEKNASFRGGRKIRRCFRNRYKTAI